MQHFLGRGFQGKAMVVSIDKATALRTYEKVKRAWEAETAARARRAGRSGDRPGAVPRIRGAPGPARDSVDMAVIVSPARTRSRT